MGIGLGDLNPVRIIEGKGAVGESAIGKLAPLALGAYLGPGAFGIEGLGMSAGAAGLAAGAGVGALTGSLEKGLMAGLGAYGGAGLGEAAAKGVTSATLDRQEAILNAIKNEQAVVPDALTSGESFKAAMGKEGIGALGAKDLAQYGLAAAAPSLLEQKKLNPDQADLGKNAYIRPKVYDPVTHRYYDLPAVKAADWGARSFADYRDSLIAPAREYASGGVTDDGMAGGGPMMGTDSAFDFQQRSEPVVRMADGGYATFTPQQINDYITKNNLDEAGIAAATKEFHVDPAAVAAARAGISSAAPAVPAAPAAPAATPAAPSYTSYTPEQMGNYFAKNPNADITAATKQFNADPAQVNQYITGLAKDYFDPTATKLGSGYLPQYQNLIKEGMTPAEYAAAVKAINPDWGKTGYWNQDTVSHAYDVADKILKFDPQTDKVTPSDKEWAAFMDSNAISVGDIARATGLSTNEVQRRYDAAKEKPVVKTTTDTYTGGTTTIPTAYAPTGTKNPYGNATNPGDITINPDGSRTVTPNIPGRPYGGFTGMGQLRDAYTAGGGNLGQVLAPTQKYTTSGGTKAAYDYLMGKGSWADTQTQPAMAKRNTYIDFSNPSEAEKKQFAKYAKVWRDGVMVDNPYYANPVTTKANGGLMDAYAHGGPTHLGDYSDGGRLLRGPGDGVSDSIPATIGGKQPARLADGEFVVPARIVSELGNGSTEAGARKLYAMMDRVQKARGKTVGKGKVAKNTRADKYLPG